MTVDAIGRTLATVRSVVYGLVVAVLGLGVGIILLAVHVLHRQQTSDTRYEHLRQAICFAISGIPSKPLTRDDRARLVKLRAGAARDGHPRDCYPPAAHPTATPTPTPSPPRTVVVVPSSSPRPSPSRTASPRPHHKPRPSHSPRPTPSPSRGCLRHPIHCLKPGAP